MASSSYHILLFGIAFLSSMAITKADFNLPLPPTVSPYSDRLCDVVNCGRGNCAVDAAKPFGFVCRCDSGWNRTRFDNEDDLQFLPCVIPNCGLDYSCMPAPPPTPPIPDKISLFDPCYWTYCGEGTCMKNHTLRNTCECKTGFTNLMNISYFPCLSQCAIGTDCRGLGIGLSSPPPPGGRSQVQAEGSESQGNRVVSAGAFRWIGLLVISITVALWK